MTVKYVQYGKVKHRIVPLKEGGTKLSILGSGISDITEIIGLNEQNNLVELDLSRNQIKEIKGLENLTDLRMLRLSSNQISETKGLEHLVNLEELYLNGNRIKEVESLDNLTNLRVLDLSYNEITKSKALEKLPNFKKRELICAQIKPKGVFDELTKFPSFIICPSCNKRIRIESNKEGLLKTDELLTLRLRTPLYVLPGKKNKARLDVSVCSQCNTIVGIGRKM